MRRLLRRLLTVVLVAAVLFGAWVAYLAATSARPRSSEGWERLPDMPAARGELAAAVGQREVDCDEPGGCRLTRAMVVAGGFSGAGRVSDAVSIFDIDQDRWLEGPPLPEARHHAAAAAIDGTVYVTGGGTEALDWVPLDNMWFLPADAAEWQRVAPEDEMPEGRLGHAMAAVGGKLYVIGGRGETSNVLIFDPRRGAWSLGAQMPAPRDHLALAVEGTRIWAIGGRDTQLLRRVDIYDTERDEWLEGPPLPRPMSAMAAAALSDGIHVVGGEDPKTFGGHVFDLHLLFRTGSRTWEEASLPIVAVHGAAYTVFDGRLVIAGGSRRQSTFSPLGWTGLTQAFEPATDDPRS